MAKALNTAACIINWIPNAFNVIASFEIVHSQKPLMNMKTFGAEGSTRVPGDKAKNLDPKVF